jgi:hypothetical protein
LVGNWLCGSEMVRVVWLCSGEFAGDLSDGSAARDDTTRCTTHLRPEVSPRKDVRGTNVCFTGIVARK